ncbi:hypothetical protein [Deinococcus sp. SL84]|uniref:hypothetical protein n=1 Tax=Deinococcus sp. SL84 TaxID=2994663 RepID=UPI002275277C|nr:hypothetical protein [Deinococcus sp. SL84]MCY1704294.1 hypothetical protein [Deinococcus sp. SL84]
MAEKKKRFAYASAALAQPVEQLEQEVLADDEVLAEPQKQQRSTQRKANTAKRAAGVPEPELTSDQEQPGEQAVTAIQSESQVLAKQSKHQNQQSGITLQLGNLEEMVAPPQRRGRVDAAGEGRMATPREQLNVRITPELKRAAGAVAALKGLTMGDVVEQALLKYIQEEL